MRAIKQRRCVSSSMPSVANKILRHDLESERLWVRIIPLLILATWSFPVLSQQADLIYINGNVITIRSTGDRAEAIAIKADKIIRVGLNNEVTTLKGPSTKVIDLKGKTVVPGFNDAHLHPSPKYPFESVHASIDVSPTVVKNNQELIELLKKKAAITPEGLPIRGFGYQDTKLGGHPTKYILDQVSLKHPVIIRHSSGHISAVNSYVLKLAGVTKDTPDPPGGSFDRDPDGTPNGVCRESALGEFYRSKKLREPSPPSEKEEMDAYQKTFDEYLSNGITSVTEAGSSFKKMGIYKKLQAQGLALRINLLMSESSLDEVIQKGITRGYGNENLRISGIKVFHGNSLSGRTCWLNQPYDMINPETGKKDYYGIPPKRNQSELDSLFLKIHSHGLQIACHSNGDREIEMVLTSLEKIQQVRPHVNSRHRIEHCSITTQSILNRIKNDSVVIVVHSYIYEHGDKMIVYGPARWDWMFPNRKAIDMGISVAQHSDSPISAAIPLLRIQSLATRTSAEGIEIGPKQKISPEEAIRLWTYGGAYASFEEKIKGSIQVGKLADLVVLSDDPTKTEASKIKDIKVDQTIIGGNVVYDRKGN
jgi:predicted amidohydrolase YtcJ